MSIPATTAWLTGNLRLLDRQLTKPREQLPFMDRQLALLLGKLVLHNKELTLLNRQLMLLKQLPALLDGQLTLLRVAATIHTPPTKGQTTAKLMAQASGFAHDSCGAVFAVTYGRNSCGSTAVDGGAIGGGAVGSDVASKAVLPLLLNKLQMPLHSVLMVQENQPLLLLPASRRQLP
ncbi:MAG: hypothetical protein FRX49_01584 [Trebouxia sp. A1-2]|nr:MAG: hypothetical protein FRX49_01584 [Trebouxia sp. A1-2]